MDLAPRVQAQIIPDHPALLPVSMASEPPTKRLRGQMSKFHSWTCVFSVVGIFEIGVLAKIDLRSIVSGPKFEVCQILLLNQIHTFIVQDWNLQ